MFEICLDLEFLSSLKFFYSPLFLNTSSLKICIFQHQWSWNSNRIEKHWFELVQRNGLFFGHSWYQRNGNLILFLWMGKNTPQRYTNRFLPEIRFVFFLKRRTRFGEVLLALPLRLLWSLFHYPAAEIRSKASVCKFSFVSTAKSRGKFLLLESTLVSTTLRFSLPRQHFISNFFFTLSFHLCLPLTRIQNSRTLAQLSISKLSHYSINIQIPNFQILQKN